MDNARETMANKPSTISPYKMILSSSQCYG